MAIYRTIQAISEGFYKEKGSKFLAFAVPVSSEEEVKAFIAKQRKAHHLAVHVCSAFRLGAGKKIYRSSDDGEPSNSAGPPILGQIQAYELTNVLIAIVRYYGGTNLGVGGLITAYKTAAKDALENAIIIEKEEMEFFEFTCSYEQMPSIMSLLKKEEVEIVSTQMDLQCVFRLNLILSKAAFLKEAIEKLI
ncbi:MAG: hypothetical protein RLZZ65_1821 [Bacteroidota bacterium]